MKTTSPRKPKKAPEAVPGPKLIPRPEPPAVSPESRVPAWLRDDREAMNLIYDMRAALELPQTWPGSKQQALFEELMRRGHWLPMVVNSMLGYMLDLKKEGSAPITFPEFVEMMGWAGERIQAASEFCGLWVERQ